jgi:23S rRNA pseudouridine2604 synthase
MEKIEYPIRINRFLYLNNLCSRRQADRFIEQGLVKINGEVAVLGQKVNEGDKVEIAEEIEERKASFKYVKFYKPKGISTEDAEVEYKALQGLHSIGRLDKDSEGLLFVTNDTRIVDRMLNPKNEHDKEYRVRVDKDLKPSFKNKMQKGVNIEGYMTKPCKVEPTGPKSFKIILTEGKKHQIRRMCAALGYQVQNLKRTRIMNINLGSMTKGESKELSPEVKFELLREVELI